MRISDWSSDVCSSDLLLRNPPNLKGSEQVRLAEVLEANKSLMAVYVMKDQLKALWNAPTAWAWRSAWTQWLRHARESGIPDRKSTRLHPRHHCAPSMPSPH